ncbi:hypothetical protein D9M71_721300 [compost metagenome]
MGLPSSIVPQDLFQLVDEVGLDGAFTDICPKSCATSRGVAVADTVNGNDTSRPAACVSAQDQAAFSCALHYSKAISRCNPWTSGNRTAQCSCGLHCLAQVLGEKVSGEQSIQQ